MYANKYFLERTALLLLAILLASIAGSYLGFSFQQVLILTAFSLSIAGTLLFWHFRLSFAFLGTAIILFTGAVNLNEFLSHSSMEIILFLIGMMILVGFLKEIGIFTWLLQKALVMRNISAKKFMIALIFTSALLACAIDEVSSILFMVMIILELSDYFEVDPVPFIIASVMATNIGSAGTVIGNPIGIMIAAKAHLTFEDFLRYAFPVMLASLCVLTWLLLVIFRKAIRELDEKIKIFEPNDILIQLLSVPADIKLKIGFVIAAATLTLIGFHHRLEIAMGLETNTVLLIAPLFFSAIIMVWRRDKARSYIEKDVEWWTLLFFIFLFAQAGVVATSGIAETIAHKMLLLMAHSKLNVIISILFGGALISSALDNVVVVAGSIPILQSLNAILDTKSILWWALLFGACFGGNMTVVGSTANIIAIGTLEKQRNRSISFRYWLKIGLVVGFVTLTLTGLILLLVPYYK